MSADEAPEAALLRKFTAAIAGAELADLRALADGLSQLSPAMPVPAVRPELRRPPLQQVALFRIRADLDSSAPPIWRRLELRSDLSLDIVHQVLQTAFDWTDSHLHRFSLGGGPFDAHTQLFLCPFDAEEPEYDDGVPAAQVRLDETMQEPGDVLRYVYDYGDSWELTLRLEVVEPADADSPTARVIDGRRAAPPEDCGGLTDSESLADVLDDPAFFDLDGVNERLRAPYFVLREFGIEPRLVDMVNRLRFTSAGEGVTARAVSLISAPECPGESEIRVALRAYQWFLDRAVGEGIPLTAAGYLKPADVTAASEIVPAMNDWIGENNREVNCAPLLDFRRALQSAGLLRKHKGRLLLTRVGASAQRHPAALWDHLAAPLLPAGGTGFETPATLLLLLYVATSDNAHLPRQEIASALGRLGWRHSDGRPLGGYEIYRLPAFSVLANVGDTRDSGGDTVVSSAAAALARAALCTRRRQ